MRGCQRSVDEHGEEGALSVWSVSLSSLHTSVTEILAQQCGQWRARRYGNAGVYGNGGIEESVTYRIQRVLSGSNPTLSAISIRAQLRRNSQILRRDTNLSAKRVLCIHFRQ
jgi:hypothetical protein